MPRHLQLSHQSQQPNVLNTLGAAAQIQNVMNQNKLFQQQYNTNLALSNIYKEAINPMVLWISPNSLGYFSAIPMLPMAFLKPIKIPKRHRYAV